MTAHAPPPRPLPKLLQQMLAIMERWRDRINADGRRAADVQVWEERGRVTLLITVYPPAKPEASRPRNPSPNGAESGNGAGEQAGVDLE